MRVNLQQLPDPAPLVERFRADIRTGDVRSALRRNVIFGACYLYPRRENEYALLQDVATHFDIHPANTVIVGSGKLGFSIAPHKRYTPFHDKSDIDVVIIDEGLFGKIWWEIHQAGKDRYDWPKRTDFADYLMRGWIRPDMFPDIKAPTVNGWWDYFKKLSRVVGVKVRGAVYRDWRFFESYHSMAISACLQEMNADDVRSRPTAPARTQT